MGRSPQRPAQRRAGGEHRAPLADFYQAAIEAQLPQATRLADTIQTCWPAILTALLQEACHLVNRGPAAASLDSLEGGHRSAGPGTGEGRRVLWGLRGGGGNFGLRRTGTSGLRSQLTCSLISAQFVRDDLDHSENA